MLVVAGLHVSVHSVPSSCGVPKATPVAGVSQGHILQGRASHCSCACSVAVRILARRSRQFRKSSTEEKRSSLISCFSFCKVRTHALNGVTAIDHYGIITLYHSLL